MKAALRMHQGMQRETLVFVSKASVVDDCMRQRCGVSKLELK